MQLPRSSHTYHYYTCWKEVPTQYTLPNQPAPRTTHSSTGIVPRLASSIPGSVSRERPFTPSGWACWDPYLINLTLGNLGGDQTTDGPPDASARLYSCGTTTAERPGWALRLFKCAYEQLNNHLSSHRSSSGGGSAWPFPRTPSGIHYAYL